MSLIGDIPEPPSPASEACGREPKTMVVQQFACQAWGTACSDQGITQDAPLSTNQLSLLIFSPLSLTYLSENPAYTPLGLQ